MGYFFKIKIIFYLNICYLKNMNCDSYLVLSEKYYIIYNLASNILFIY